MNTFIQLIEQPTCYRVKGNGKDSEPLVFWYSEQGDIYGVLRGMTTLSHALHMPITSSVPAFGQDSESIQPVTNFFLVGTAANSANAPMGYFLKPKTKKMAKLTADRIFTDTAFERTQENMDEFARAGNATRVIRTAFREALTNSTDKNLSGRLVKKMMEIIQRDTTSTRGERLVSKGETMLLKGFNFNKRAPLHESLFVRPTVTVDRPAGAVSVAFPSFIPKARVLAPGGTTHFRITAIGAAINFETEDFTAIEQSTADLPWDQNALAAINLPVALPAASTDPILVVVGISFYQHVNGSMYALKDGRFNAASIVQVNKPA